MSLLLVLALLGAAQQASQASDPERSAGDSELATPSRRNPDPEPSLASIGREAFRFSTSPALQRGEALIVTVTPDPQGDAIARIGTRRHICRDSERRDCRMVSSRGDRFAFCVEHDCNYQRLAARLHALLLDPNQVPADVICLDGPGYLTELREKGQTRNRSGFCGDAHPNSAIYRLVRQGAGSHWPRLPDSVE